MFEEKHTLLAMQENREDWKLNRETTSKNESKETQSCEKKNVRKQELLNSDNIQK